MYLKNIKLNKNDFELLRSLARLKLLSANDAKLFYGSSYYQKRLQELKNANYISRFHRTYIKLTSPARKYLESVNIKCAIPCKNKKYMERVAIISEIGLRLMRANINFNLSWELKGANYTNWSRRYVGNMKYRGEDYLFYIAKDNEKYIRSLHFDINKDLDYQNVLVFVDDLNVITQKNQFIFPNKTSCLIINRKSVEKLEKYNKLDVIETLKNKHGKCVTESNISVADACINNIETVYMPFIDTHKIAAINNLYSLGMLDRKIVVMTLKENMETLERLFKEGNNKQCVVMGIEEARVEE